MFFNKRFLLLRFVVPLWASVPAVLMATVEVFAVLIEILVEFLFAFEIFFIVLVEFLSVLLARFF